MRTTGKQAAAMIAAEEQGFEAAERFADEHGGTVAEFTRRSGWHFWEHKGRVFSGYTPQDFLNVAGDDYNVATNDADEVADRLTSLAEQFAGDMDKLREQFNEMAQLWDKVAAALDEHTVVSYCGQYFDTLPPEMMNFSHDTHQYIIGVYLPKEMSE